MSTINFNNKSLVFPQIVVNRGRTATRQLTNTTENGETITNEVKLTETVINKSETDKVTKFESKARQAMLKLTTPGPKGMHLMDASKHSDMANMVMELRAEAADLNNSFTVCQVQVDCVVLPVDLTLDATTADKMRAHIHTLLVDLRNAIVGPDMATSPVQRYSKARNMYYACQHLVSWTSGLNTDLVRAAIDEAGEQCINVKSTPPSDMPSMNAAIQLFDTVDVENAPLFAELPF